MIGLENNQFLNLSKKDVHAHSSSHIFEKIKWGNYQIQLEHPIEINLNFVGNLWECPMKNWIFF